jgi:hypothetical protein
MGPFWEMRALPEDGSACRRCDWECFRDPSELFGPFGAALRNPFAGLRNFAATPGAFGTWLTDLRYYLACDTFDGTRPMRPEKLARLRAPHPNPSLPRPSGRFPAVFSRLRTTRPGERDPPRRPNRGAGERVRIGRNLPACMPSMVTRNDHRPP